MNVPGLTPGKYIYPCKARHYGEILEFRDYHLFLKVVAFLMTLPVTLQVIVEKCTHTT